ncbi:Protein CBG08823 [Caenorhabditis briggsae]|nr:Protein CBG08823 [Caenorhabditis briggsae]CAP28582.1 Protein CBG08823 [Caenorhabditis briggsae]
MVIPGNMPSAFPFFLTFKLVSSCSTSSFFHKSLGNLNFRSKSVTMAKGNIFVRFKNYIVETISDTYHHIRELRAEWNRQQGRG